MKKCLALMMMVVLCFSIFSVTSLGAFTDVEEGHRHEESITYLTEKGVINGYEDGSFKPEDTITRAEFLKMILEFLGFGNVYGDSIVTTGFSDVDAKVMTVTTTNEEGKEETNNTYTKQHWAAGYIKLAVDKGVVNGYGDGRFGPDDPVKYEEAIKMIVCSLGREEHAINKAQSIGANLWPDGYLSVGNDLMISKSTEYLLGGNATRSNVAQMLYNVKDVQIYIAPNISFGGSTGGSTGGSSGGNYKDSADVVEDLETSGQVVAAVKQNGESTKTIFIDNNVVIDGENITSLNKNYIIIKFDRPDEYGNNYGKFYIGANDYSEYLGYNVKIKYAFNPDTVGGGRCELRSMIDKGTLVVKINSNQFKLDKTTQKNSTETNVHICYTDGNEDYYQSFYTDDLDTLTVIYNNKVIDVEALGNDPAVKSDVITLSDLMPANGSIKIVDADDDTEIDVVWVESYETYVVGAVNFNTTPKSIDDKFMTTGGTTPLSLVLNDADPGVSLQIVKGGSKKVVTDIRKNDVLRVAQSKCGTSIDVTIESTTQRTLKFGSSKTKNGAVVGFVMDNGTTYSLTDYCRNYVEPELEYESGDTMTLYLNSESEVVWATVAEVSYSTGYLVKAVYNEQNDHLLLKILTTSGKIEELTMADSKTKYITKANSCLSSASGTENDNGYLYKNLPKALIFESLKENARIINNGTSEETTDDKPSGIIVNAETSQPIMYTKASTNTLSHLITLEPDVANRYTGTSLQYKKLSTGEHNFGDTFSASSSAIFIFVPNNRDSNATAYKIGNATSSAISKKLVAYTDYNIEPFFFTNSSGVQNRAVFVVYNENIDAIPTYRSENMIVSSITPNLSGETVTFTIRGYVASNSSTKPYTVNAERTINNAYVLDENFERTNVKTRVEVGDVIRVGYHPSGASVASIDIILDASEAKATVPKATAVKKNGTLYDLSTEEPEDYAVCYFARIGEVTAIDSSNVKEWCDIKISDSKTDRINLGSTYSDKQILLYNYREEDNLETEDKDERLMTATMDDLWGGEMLYIWQGEDMEIKQIYAIRYPEVQP